MDLWIPLQRGTLLIPTGPKLHLHIILTDPAIDPLDDVSKMLLVSISTVRHIRPDDTCILRPDDHPFIRQESFVDYARANRV